MCSKRPNGFTIALATWALCCGCTRFETPKPPAPPSGSWFHDIPAGSSGVWRQTASGIVKTDEFTPPTDRRFDPLENIRFQPGDSIAVRAGGCANGKLYVDPYGTSSRIDRGTIWIPGATPFLVRIGAVEGRQIAIPKDFPGGPVFLRLGYDLGSGPGPTEQQACAGQPKAWLQLLVTNASPPDVRTPGDLDMQWSDWDPNLLPYHPYWSYKVRPEYAKSCVGKAADLQNCPDAQAACKFVLKDDRVSFGTGPCTTQNPSIDRPVGDIATGICGLGGLFSGQPSNLHGHVNWFPATYTGTLKFDQRGPDGDLNIHLAPIAPPGVPADSILTRENARSSELKGTIELEFNDEETIYRFQSDWWTRFKTYVDAEGRVVIENGTVEDRNAARLIDGATAVVTGLASVDNEHGAHAELHPVYAMAVRTYDSPKDNAEQWAFFVRNWGNQGECSNAIHFLDLPDDSFTFRLPWDGGAGEKLPAVSAEYGYGFDGDNRKFEISSQSSPEKGLLVKFKLPKRPEEHATLEGVLTVEWQSLVSKNPLQAETFAVTTTGAETEPAKPSRPAKSGEGVLDEIYAHLDEAGTQKYHAEIRKLAESTPTGNLEEKESERIQALIDALGDKIHHLTKQQTAFLCRVRHGDIPGVCKGN